MRGMRAVLADLQTGMGGARTELVGVMSRAVIVVPCYNEADRLPVETFASFSGHDGRVSLRFVNDGSRDATAAVLTRLCERLQGKAQCTSLPRNCGKAEAVRQGMLQALAEGADIVGYLDADLATPLDEALRLLDWLETRPVDVALASRVRLLGTDITRQAVRHYLGRVFATLASLALRLPVYDTQCGAKFFRRTPALEAALAHPFLSRWVFDVELLGRLLTGTAEVPGLAQERFVEMPLGRWRDVRGSRIRLSDLPRMGIDLLRAWRQLWRLRRQRALKRDKV